MRTAITKRNIFAGLAAIAALALLFSFSVTASAASTLFGDAELVAAGGNPGGALQLRSDATPGWGGASFDDADGILFSALTTLQTDYNVTNDDCGAGSPRFQIQVDEDNDNVEEASDGSIYVYLGPSPSYTDCAPGWLSSGNLIGNNDAGRWSSEQIPGGVNTGTYAQALAAASGMKIWDISIVVDSGWNAAAANDGDGEQTILIDNLTINNTTYAFEPAPDVTVTIHKYVDNAHADATNAVGLSFPMASCWTATNIGSGCGTYSLAPATYDAQTSSMSSGADYSTNEDTTGSSVGATCADGKPYALVGYSTGDTEAAAAAAATTATPPSFTGLTSDKHVIVRNASCTNTPPPTSVVPTTKDQCKKGGWMTLKDTAGNSFKNQGDCVSFVSTQGKNKAAGN